MMQEKQAWVLTGGNGAGKSTFYRQFLAPENLHFINADIIARRLDEDKAEALSYDAAILAGKLRNNLLKEGMSFCFETVFSHPSKIDFLAEAKAHNYQLVLIYIHLISDELNQARVIQRVAEGGHNVPADKIVSRIPRTMQNIRKALPLADIVRFYDNSYRDQPFQAVAEIRNASLQTLMSPMPDWAKGMLSDYLD